MRLRTRLRRSLWRFRNRKLFDGSVTVIDRDEFEKARRDPRVIALHQEAAAYWERCKREGRIHE